ncbi:MAG: four helix bundle protein [Bacteroidetes bacterium]|nr:four helix bundle protein [Bacteroidota bacterium]
MEESYKESIIQEKSFKFSLLIIALYRKLYKVDNNPILRQLLRSATSIGANVNEGSAGQTKKDFITKMSIASKEARETSYWLKLLNESKWYDVDLKLHLTASNDILKILTKIVKTSQENLKVKINSNLLKLKPNH